MKQHNSIVSAILPGTLIDSISFPYATKRTMPVLILIGTLMHSCLFAQFGNALHFNGSTGYVSANVLSFALDNPPAMSMEAWCYVTSDVSYPVILAFNTTSGTSSNRNMIEFYNTQFDYFDQSVGSKYSSSFSMNEWHHVAAVFTSEAINNAFFYVDGVLQSTFTTSVRPDPSVVTGEFSIGQEWDGGTPTQLFAGYIDEVRIWNRALTQSEIQSSMVSEIPVNSLGLVAYYKMTDGSGSTLTDNTGNGNTGALVGGVSFASPPAPLPIEMMSFTATVRSAAVELLWSTATERDNSGFEIERSVVTTASQLHPPHVQGGQWTTVGFIEGSGTSYAPKEYSFTDKDISSGTYFYRLKQLDRDGKYEYSKEISAEVTEQMPHGMLLMQNYPNPFNPITTIEFSIPLLTSWFSTSKKGEFNGEVVTLKVYDMLGKEVATVVNKQLTAGNYSVLFDASQLSSGVYWYILQSGNFMASNKFVLMK
ncbi:MAG: LamG-like jellyroll fold domain-containing protein [Bacteriovoracaceae bacterium]|nr:T9SS type A sorting domain-containing protein [Bacteroidota bacterium]